MRICREVLISAAVLFAGLTTPALAQSSAVIVPGAVAEGTTPAAPVKPLDILDTDYPLESLLANEEGKIQLNLIVNARGQVTAARVLTPTKLTRLEQQAANIARTRWQFTPAMRDGEGVAAQVNVDVEWKLPLRFADDLYSDMMGIPVIGKNFRLPKGVPGTHAIRAEDYPVISLRRSEQGEVDLRVQVLTTGVVGEIELINSSGFRSLDNAAVAMAKNRWRYEPGLVDGKPADMWVTSSVQFQISFSPRPGPFYICTRQPMIGDPPRITSEGVVEGPSVKQWYHLTAAGDLDDVIIQTNIGWMHFQDAMRRNAQEAMKSVISQVKGRPCWLHGPGVFGAVDSIRATRTN
jgi:TonB family protein